MAGEVEAVREAIRALEGISDPSARAKATTELLREWPDLHRELREVRQHAVQTWHEQGATFDEIGPQLGTSGYRASQISRGK
ncbi:hypothetical protein U9R90_25045 [Streptomyces sp. E11-3]|uniref:hypothetical protein n=1 Tax=Streptomyces sp. E11-3 TaxID=3110112 RepID=UPI00397ED9AE